MRPAKVSICPYIKSSGEKEREKSRAGVVPYWAAVLDKLINCAVYHIELG